MKDSKVDNEQQIRDETLMNEEFHYVHTMNAFVELIVIYGWDKVIGDLRTAMGEKQW
jgi:hypothetical protein